VKRSCACKLLLSGTYTLFHLHPIRPTDLETLPPGRSFVHIILGRKESILLIPMTLDDFSASLKAHSRRLHGARWYKAESTITPSSPLPPSTLKRAPRCLGPIALGSQANPKVYFDRPESRIGDDELPTWRHLEQRPSQISRIPLGPLRPLLRMMMLSARVTMGICDSKAL
jgi:hypothetical protein